MPDICSGLRDLGLRFERDSELVILVRLEEITMFQGAFDDALPRNLWCLQPILEHLDQTERAP